jgi:hypothetical protein
MKIFLALAVAAFAQSATVRQLHVRFVETVDNAAKQKVLDELARTAPVSQYDVEALYDLFMRFPDDAVRNPTLESLQLMSPSNIGAEPLVLRCLADQEADSVLFGLKAALRLRTPAALPLVKKIAGRKFKQPTATDAAIIAERNAWWAQYEALSVLAQWEGEEALPLIRKKAREAAGVARLLGTHFWKQELPEIIEWSRGGTADRARAYAAAVAPAPSAALRASREPMLTAVRDVRADGELRHQLALKVGASSLPEEVPSLLKEYEAAPDDFTKKLWAAAVFATRDQQAVPLLKRFAQEDPQPLVRLGARFQLRDLLPPADYRPVLEWAAKSEPDRQNRELAERELKQ